MSTNYTMLVELRSQRKMLVIMGKISNPLSQKNLSGKKKNVCRKITDVTNIN